jgi:lipoyl(octanoyl) transferase
MPAINPAQKNLNVGMAQGVYHHPPAAGNRDWIFIDTGKHTGKFNMDFDIHLVDEFNRSGKPILRFYSWEPYCISLGKNQNNSDINLALAKQDEIDVVKRPTGGKAVLHAEELTYSVVTKTNGLSVRESYNLISTALVEGLRKICADLELSQSSADFRKLFHDPSAIPCFSTSAVYEVEWHRKKLVGSAQHRFASPLGGDTLLQHGSILIGDFHKRIVDYLNIDEEMKRRTIADLDSHTITLAEILNRQVDSKEIKDAVKAGFENVFGAEFNVRRQPSEGSEDMQDFSRPIAENR